MQLLASPEVVGCLLSLWLAFSLASGRGRGRSRRDFLFLWFLCEFRAVVDLVSGVAAIKTKVILLATFAFGVRERMVLDRVNFHRNASQGGVASGTTNVGSGRGGSLVSVVLGF